MVSPSIPNARDPWFESRSWYDRFLYVNIHLFILMPVSCNVSNLLRIYICTLFLQYASGQSLMIAALFATTAQAKR